jgi:hypothetical protein
MLAPALLEQGFVPYRLVRRGSDKAAPPDRSLLKVVGQPASEEQQFLNRTDLELMARLERRDGSSRDRLFLESTPNSPIEKLLDDDYSSAFFTVGYGATRRVETGDYSESSARRSRGRRYQRIAGLFEDHVALRPLSSWLERLRHDDRTFGNAVTLIDTALPPQIRFSGHFDLDEDQYIFDFEGVPTPFTALSDGYKAFIGWVGDLVGHLSDISRGDLRLEEIEGIVLVDEIDLHLHPAWQRDVIPTLAKVFPRLQFVLTSHSPLVASTVKRENIFVTEASQDGTATIKQLDEFAYGRSAEQLLLSSYFGLTSTRPPDFHAQAETLFKRVAGGDSEAALEYMKRLTASVDGPEEQSIKA